MKRRSFLGVFGVAAAVSVGGCSGGSTEDSDPNSPGENSPTETSTPTATEEDLPRPYTQGPAHLLWAYWVDEAPSDIDPYPSDEPPVSDHDVVHTVFDDALEHIEQDDSGRGNGVFWEVSESTFYEIEYAFDDIEGNGDRPLYFEHKGEVIALKFDVPD